MPRLVSFVLLASMVAACSSTDPGVSPTHRTRDPGPSAAPPSPGPNLPPQPSPPSTTPPTSDDAGSGVDAADATTPIACAACINAGGPAYTATSGRIFTADSGSDSGQIASTTNPIAGTTDMTLYQTERYGTSFTYSLPVPNGAYTLRLHFAEFYWTNAGQRVFNVDVQGARVLDNFDIIQDVGAANTAVIKSFPVTASDGKVDIAFTTITDAAKISAIELVAGSSGASTMDAGSD